MMYGERNIQNNLVILGDLLPLYIYCRLDFFLISFNLVSSSTKNKIISGTRSDHIAVIMPPNLETQRGPGFWKLNCSLLQDQKYIETEDGLMWETIKYRIKGAMY